MSAAELLENPSVSFQTDILVSLSDHPGTQKDSNYEWVGLTDVPALLDHRLKHHCSRF